MASAPEKWETIKALFEAAQDLSPEELTAFLAESAPDEDVRAEVRRLISEYHQAGTFLSTPALAEFRVHQHAAHGQVQVAGEIRLRNPAAWLILRTC